MFSIIVCSINQTKLAAFKASLACTIGVDDYQLIVVDNSVEQLSITQAYNQGASLARHEHLLFVHEDVLFHTSNWGVKLMEELDGFNVGLVGVAGSTYVPYAAIGFTNPVREYNYAYLLQWNGKESVMVDRFPCKEEVIQTIDGVFMAVKKEVWEAIQFNEKIDGFHGYDLDFSLRVSEYYINKITNRVLIEHLSMGSLCKTYLTNVIQVKRAVQGVNQRNDCYNEYSAYRSFVVLMRAYRFKSIKYFASGMRFLSYKRLGAKNYLKSLVFLGVKYFDNSIQSRC